MPRRPLVRADRAAAAFVLAIAAPVVLGLAAPARAAFTGGPSVRVSPHPTSGFDVVEIRWIGDFAGDGKVELFDNAAGTGTPVITKLSPSPALDHTIAFDVLGIVTADTTFYFRVTHHDPNNNRPDLTNEPPPFPSLFTGAQAIGGVTVQPNADSALISWDANVIGFGEVAYGLTTPGDIATLADSLNITDHTIELTGLLPETTYRFRVSNLHAIDGGALASEPGLRSGFLSFTTLAVPEPSTAVAVAVLAVTLARRRRRTGGAAA